MGATREPEIASELGSGGAATVPLDLTLEYLRRYPERVLGIYLLAILPMTGAMLWLVDVVTAQRRSALPAVCVLLVAATVWRWVGQAMIQRRIQADLRREAPPQLRGSILPIIVVRALANFMITWGSLLIIPALLGFWLAGFAAPMMLEEHGRSTRKFARTWQWMQHGLTRLARTTSILLLLLLLVCLAVLGMHTLFLGTVLPSLLGIDVTELQLTVSGAGWWLAIGYFVFLAFDLFWTVASVMVFYDLRSSRLGTDLRARLQELATT
ncbi:MAG: hypothetical protein WD294_16705 [Phycisphaeraceae bacterium]